MKNLTVGGAVGVRGGMQAGCVRTGLRAPPARVADPLFHGETEATRESSWVGLAPVESGCKEEQ